MTPGTIRSREGSLLASDGHVKDCLSIRNTITELKLMHAFKNILVGIDLAQCQTFDIHRLSPMAWETFHWGIKLAQAGSAQLLFFSANNLSEEALSPLDEEDRSHIREAIVQGGGNLLEDLVREAAVHGVRAQAKIVQGEPVPEINRQVLRNKHDLVIAGTRGLTGLRRTLFGNTALKLLRRCPCPVLVPKPMTFASGILGADLHRRSSRPASSGLPLNILVTTNLRPSSEQALRLGISLAAELNAHLFILHVVEYQLDEVCNIGLPDAKQEQYRRRVRANAQEVLHRQLESTEYRSLGSRVEVHLAGDVGLPDVAIQHFIAAHKIHLLVMGTIARRGLLGLTIGNTAERLLPEVPCSVLAVKPSEVVHPVEP